ncbi:MAG: hypothetical protein ABIZ96_05650 [Gemmatimonadales bacterium]
MSPEQLLGQIEAEESVVLADFEAGLGTLSRLKAGQLDVVLIVAEPTAKSLEVARRAVELLRERTALEPIIVANRVAGAEERLLIERTLAGTSIVIVPDDPAIRAADLRGVAPFDAMPDAPAVRAVRGLSARLLTSHLTDAGRAGRGASPPLD